MTSTFAQVGRVLLVVALVSSMVAAPVAGSTASPAAPDGPAATSGGTCSYASVLHWFGVSTAQCSPSAPIASSAENKVEIYQDAVETKAWAENSITQTSNSLTNLQTILYASGEAEQNAVIKNGTTSVSSVNLAVNQSIDERVSKMQYNQLQTWNQYVQSVWAIAQATNDSSVSDDYISQYETVNVGTGTSFEYDTIYNKFDDLGGGNVTLSNGSSATRLYLSATYNLTFPDSAGDIKKWSVGPVNDKPRLQLMAATGQYQRMQSNWQTLTKKAQIAKENLAATASWKVDAYNAGELDLANATSSLTLAQEYSTRYAETGTLAYARAAAAAAGYATPDLANVSVMTVRSNGYNYTGALLSQHAPDNGTWSLGQQYDASAIDGVQLVATTDGRMQTLTGNFTVTSLKNANGESLNQTHVRQYSYRTSNVSQYLEMQQELNQLREEVANQTASGGTGPGGGSGSGNPAVIVGVLAVLAVAGVVFLNRGD